MNGKTISLALALLLSGCATTGIDYYRLCNGAVDSYSRNGTLDSEQVWCANDPRR